ncbi:sulfite reductase subunit beta [Flagelloscypha sp. PMI_526]|nr:sulfite reductase subunit beta [Flagelloscypha sp. PMI_526]
MSSLSVNAVARIALLASDVLVDTHSSPFSTKYASYTSPNQPKIVTVPSGADVGSTLVQHTSSNLTSFTGVSGPHLLARLVLHLSDISDKPIVLHLAISDDLSDALLLRSAVPYFVLSTSAQEAHDNALLASKLARNEKKAVVHAFYSDNSDDHILEITEDKALEFFTLPSEDSHPAEDGDPITPLFKAYEIVSLQTLSVLRRPLRPLHSVGPAHPATVIFVLGRSNLAFDVEGVTFIHVSLVNPLPLPRILHAIPASATRVLVLERVQRWNAKWTPLYLDVLSALQERDQKPVVQSCIISGDGPSSSEDIAKLLEDASVTDAPHISFADAKPQINGTVIEPHVPKHEQSYTKMLSHVFGERLDIANDPSLVPVLGDIATTPEYSLGRARGQIEERKEALRTVRDLLQDKTISPDLHAILSQFLQEKDDPSRSASLSQLVVEHLQSTSIVSHPLAERIVQLAASLPVRSRWIIGSDAWSYDLGASGLHHAIASGINVNILILDTTPYSNRKSVDPSRRKHDVGLYAMNHGDVYVASVALYASYAQVLQSLMEADKFDGPSVVLAHLPYSSEDMPALEMLKETKLAVDTGYWPLYRWDPSKDARGLEPFSLDSDAVKNELKAFLDRQNHLSQLTRTKPELASEIVSSLGETVKEARRVRAEKAYEDLLSGLDRPPLLVLYASDGGNAEKVAKRLANRGKARGLSTTLGTMDSTPLESFKKAEEEEETLVVFVTSTAGQGEPPQNGRQFFKALNAAALAASPEDRSLAKLKYAVFGMGDSHYWPRPEDAQYYNKPGKDLDARLSKLGAERMVDLGLGDDQDADGYQTGYKLFEPQLWKALGVDSVEVTEAEPEPITNEHIKAASSYLRGTIAEGLQDTTTGALAPSDGQLTKFHGIYQQDDRDIRDEREAAGAEPAYSFMIRVRMPGGVCTPSQWLDMDRIADEHGSGTFKITTRQTFQFHGVIKRHLKPAIQDINRALLDTLAACGDVNRNVVCSSIPTLSKLHAQVFEFSKTVSEHLLPRTTAYHEIWLDKKMVAGEALRDFEPLYGEFYLPRKFKIAVAVPPTNDVDVFANDLGFIAITDDKGELAGFNVTVGGGMGVTHGNKKTYPRLGDIIGFCTPEEGPLVAEKVMLVQRDNGNRLDRKNARLKYTIDRMGLDVYKSEVEKLLGYSLAPARSYTFDRNVDDYGWHTGEDGRHHVTLFIENGRVQDEPSKDFKTGLREIALIHRGTFRLTTNQHLLISDVLTEDLPKIKQLLRKYGLDNLNHSGLRLSSSACVAFPTCGLAMAESERYLPILIDKVEKICEESGLRSDAIVMRMTGCPNGCARPYVAEIAFVGKAIGTYSMLLGGGYYGQRLNKIYRETVTEPEILAILRPMIKRYALERQEGERFGDWTIRAGYISATTSGKAWYDGMGGEGEWREA